MKQQKCASTMLIFIHLILIFSGCASANLAGLATFAVCYGECTVSCLICGSESQIPCAIQCLNKCYTNPTAPSQIYYQSLGCAVHNCATFGNDIKGVTDCVNNCERNASKI